MPEQIELNTQEGSFTIRSYRPGDETAILDGWKQAFRNEMQEKLWRWKYLENPKGSRIVVCLAEDGRAAAHFAGIPYEAYRQGESFEITHLVDCFSHPSFRNILFGRRGVFVQTALSFINTFTLEAGKFDLGEPTPKSRFLYGFPGDRHFSLGAKLLGYKAFTQGKLFLCLKTDQVSSSRFRRGFRLFSGRLEALENPNEEDKADAMTDFLHEADRLWNDRAQDSQSFCVARNAFYLSWRFLKHPLKEYRIFRFRSFLKGSLRGWLCGSIEKDSFKLLDFFFPLTSKGRQDFANSLVSLSQELKHRAERIEVWVSGRHPLAEVFAEVGFEPTAEPLGFIPTYCSTSLSSDVMDHFSWTMGEGDLF